MKKVILMKKKNKVDLRHTALKELISTYALEDQYTLVEMMKKRYNIDTNQSILSRDLRQLGIGKHKSKDKMIYEAPGIDASQEILRLAIVDLVYNESLIIIKTIPGLASFVGDYLDMQQNEAIAGTLAGENIIFVAPRSTKIIKEVADIIGKILNVKKT